MGKEIIISKENLVYLTGDKIDIGGHEHRIDRIEIHPIEENADTIQTLDELLDHLESTFSSPTDKFTAYVVIDTGDVYKVDNVGEKKVLIPITGLSFLEDLDEIDKGYENILKNIEQKARHASIMDITVTEDFYKTLYNLYYANEHGFLAQYIDWNKKIYNNQLNMLRNQNYPLKLLDVFPSGLGVLEVNYDKLAKNWEALSQANIAVAETVEDTVNNMAWFISNKKGVLTSTYIRELNSKNMYGALVQDYNAVLQADKERIRSAEDR